jgi:hypothetical protein
MTTTPHHPRGRQSGLVVVLAVLLAAVLLVACSDSTPSTTGNGDDTATTASGGAASTREQAEDYLHESIDQLDTVLADYRAGKTDEAYELAKSIGEGYEGVPEETVAKASPTVQRQLDPLIEATLPGAIKAHANETEIASLVERAQALITEGLEAIEKSE